MVVCSDGYITRLGCVRYVVFCMGQDNVTYWVGVASAYRGGYAGVVLELAGGLSAMLRRPVHTATSLTGDGVGCVVSDG